MDLASKYTEAIYSITEKIKLKKQFMFDYHSENGFYKFVKTVKNILFTIPCFLVFGVEFDILSGVSIIGITLAKIFSVLYLHLLWFPIWLIWSAAYILLSKTFDLLFFAFNLPELPFIKECYAKPKKMPVEEKPIRQGVVPIAPQKNTYTKDFLTGLFDVLSPVEKFGSQVFSEFAIFAIFKARLIFYAMTDEYPISESEKIEITSTFDGLMHTFFCHWNNATLIAPSQRELLIFNRMELYEEVYSKFGSNPLTISIIGDTLLGFCEYGWNRTNGKTEPYLFTDMYAILKDLKQDIRSKSKYTQVYEETELQLMDFLLIAVKKLSREIKDDIENPK